MIIINFKDKTISVDGHSVFCGDIAPLSEDWISLDIRDNNCILYRVGLNEPLNDYSFINVWVQYALEEKETFNAMLEDAEAEKIINLNNLAASEVLAREIEEENANRPTDVPGIN